MLIFFVVFFVITSFSYGQVLAFFLRSWFQPAFFGWPFSAAVQQMENEDFSPLLALNTRLKGAEAS